MTVNFALTQPVEFGTCVRSLCVGQCVFVRFAILDLAYPVFTLQLLLPWSKCSPRHRADARCSEGCETVTSRSRLSCFASRLMGHVTQNLLDVCMSCRASAAFCLRTRLIVGLSVHRLCCRSHTSFHTYEQTVQVNCSSPQAQLVPPLRDIRLYRTVIQHRSLSLVQP